MTSPHYGQLKPFDNADAHTWRPCGFPRATLILEAQALLLEMLRHIVDQVLVNADGIPGNDKFKTFVSKGLRRNSAVELSSHYLNQSFSQPPKLDVTRLAEISRVRLDVALDDVWLLQTDLPTLDVSIEDDLHAPRGLSQEPLFGGLNKAERFQAHAEHLIFERVIVAARWMRIHTSCIQLQKVPAARSFASSALAHPESDRSHPLLRENHELLLQELLERIHGSFFQLRRLPRYNDFVGTLYEDRKIFACCLDDLGLEPHVRLGKLFRQDPVFYAFSELAFLSAERQQYRFDYLDLEVARCMSMIDHHLCNNENNAYAERKTSIPDAKVMIWLADLCAVHEMFTAVRFHGSGPIIDRQSWTNAEFTKRIKSDPGTDIPDQDYVQLGSLLQKYHELPKPRGPKGPAWLQQRDARLRAMDQFWEVAEKLFWDNSDPTTELAKATKTLFGAARDSEYVSKLSAERRDLLWVAQNNNRGRDVSVAVQKEWGHSAATQKEAYVAKPKIKMKTRPTGLLGGMEKLGVEDEDDEEQTCGSAASDITEVSRVVVLKEHMSTLLLLFTSTTSTCSQTGMVSWHAFAKAMVDAGFSALHTGGSAVMFTSAHGSIALHRPHPEPKLDSIMLHIIGKRMNKHFGWTRDSFMERTKSGSADR